MMTEVTGEVQSASSPWRRRGLRRADKDKEKSEKLDKLDKLEKPEKLEKLADPLDLIPPDDEPLMADITSPPINPDTMNGRSELAFAPNLNGKTSTELSRKRTVANLNPLKNRIPFTKSHKEKRQAEEQAAKVPLSDRLKKAHAVFAKQLQADDLYNRLVEEGRKDVTKELVRKALMSNYANCDIERAVELLDVQLMTEKGWIAPYNANIHLVGAENREAVTCYLSALLAAMYLRMDAYECMIHPNPAHTPTQKRLCDEIRLWVNMTRLGMLIHVDQMKDLQEALADCGWPDARLLVQQDSSEAFAAITEALNLPLLTLEMNLFHHGKSDKDDYKVVEERLLNISVPLPAPDAPPNSEVKLEDCLEEYFNTKVEVTRDHAEEKGALMTIRAVKEEDDSDTDAGHSSDRENIDSETASQPSSQSKTSRPSSSYQHHRHAHVFNLKLSNSFTNTTESVDLSRPPVRARTHSAIQKVVLDENNRVAGTAEDAPGLLARTGAKLARTVTIPAWQIYRLVPFTHKMGKTVVKPSSDREVIRNLSECPVVGICLKRWSLQDGMIKKSTTVVDIPETMSLPHIMAAENDLGQDLSRKFKLVLQGVVAHRGESVHSGHYVAFILAEPKLLRENRRHENDPPPDYEEPQWLKFDDLAQETGGRVVPVENIRKTLKEEMPYLLFYRIVPMVHDYGEDCNISAEDISTTNPPSYTQSTIHEDRISTAHCASGKNDGLTKNTGSVGGWVDSRPEGVPHISGPSIQFSSEVVSDRRSSGGGGGGGGGGGDDSSRTTIYSRRNSMTSQGPPDISLSTTPVQPPSSSPSPSPLAPTASEAAAHKLKSVARGLITRNKSESNMENKGMLDMFRIGRPMSKEFLRTEGAVLSSSPVKDGETSFQFRRLSHSGDRSEKKEKKAKGKRKHIDPSEKPERECVVM